MAIFGRKTFDSITRSLANVAKDLEDHAFHHEDMDKAKTAEALRLVDEAMNHSEAAERARTVAANINSVLGG